jgi:hypothetical protein
MGIIDSRPAKTRIAEKTYSTVEKDDLLFAFWVINGEYPEKLACSREGEKWGQLDVKGQ